MPRTYSAILHGDRLEWTEIVPPRDDLRRPIKVMVTVIDESETLEMQAERKLRQREALERLALSNPFAEIVDPVAWQREIRRDRPLPGREDE